VPGEQVMTDQQPVIDVMDDIRMSRKTPTIA
jgi:hypothetical protein